MKIWMRSRGSIFNSSFLPYLIFVMFIVYVGIKPIAELVKVTFAQEIRGVDFSMTLFIYAYVFLKVRELFTSRHSLWTRMGFISLLLIIIMQLISYNTVLSYGNQYIPFTASTNLNLLFLHIFTIQSVNNANISP